MDEQFENSWADWMCEQGLDIEDEVRSSLLATRHLMDINDGTHGQWFDGSLGVLMVFEDVEIRELLDAWEQSREGNIMSLSSIMQWLQHLSLFLQECLDSHDTQNE